MNTKIAFAAVALAIAVAPAAFAQNNGINEVLDGTFDAALTAANFGTPVYDYTYTGSPITVNGTFSGGPASGVIGGTSVAFDPSVAGADLFTSQTPVNLTAGGGYGPTALATINVNPNALDPNNISFYGVTAGANLGTQNLSADDGIHIVNGVPEPGTVALLLSSGLGSCGLLLRRRK